MELARLTPLFEILDWVLNLGGLLLWIGWRAVANESLGVPRLSIASTLRRAESRPARRWTYFAVLTGGLLLRAVLYWQIGGAIPWMPTISLGAITLTFRSDFFGRILLYSFASYGMTLLIFHVWVLLFVMINRRTTDADNYHRIMRAHLGPMARWPVVIQLLLPWVVGSILWWISARLLVGAKLLPAPASTMHAWQQAAIIGLCTYLSWKWLLIALLLGHLVTSYVYLGRWGFWQYVNQTARLILQPLQWIPLRIAKVDFTPVVGMLLILILSQLATRGLHFLYRRLPF